MSEVEVKAAGVVGGVISGLFWEPGIVSQTPRKSLGVYCEDNILAGVDPFSPCTVIARRIEKNDWLFKKEKGS